MQFSFYWPLILHFIYSLPYPEKLICFIGNRKNFFFFGRGRRYKKLKPFQKGKLFHLKKARESIVKRKKKEEDDSRKRAGGSPPYFPPAPVYQNTKHSLPLFRLYNQLIYITGFHANKTVRLYFAFIVLPNNTREPKRLSWILFALSSVFEPDFLYS